MFVEKMVYLHKEVFAEEIEWNPHPAFLGVFLKHLVKGVDTEGKFSCHLVKVEAGCEIGEHLHAGKWELHEVVEGDGKCILEGKEINYQPGVSAVLPADMKHSVTAGGQGLYLLAKFIPALV